MGKIDGINLKEKISKAQESLSLPKLSEKEIKELLSRSKKMEVFIESELKEKGSDSVFLMVVEPNDYSLFRDSLLKVVSRQPFIYLSANKPAEHLIAKMNESGKATDEFHFIDMISELTSGEDKFFKGISFVGSPSELVESMLELEKSLEEGPKGKTVVLDSISTLLVYNEGKATEKFVHALISKLSDFNSFGLLIAVKSSEYEREIQNLSQFCDKVIKVQIEK